MIAPLRPPLVESADSAEQRRLRRARRRIVTLLGLEQTSAALDAPRRGAERAAWWVAGWMAFVSGWFFIRCWSAWF